MELCRREMRHPHAVVVRNIEITRGRIIWDCTGIELKADTIRTLDRSSSNGEQSDAAEPSAEGYE